MKIIITNDQDEVWDELSFGPEEAAAALRSFNQDIVQDDINIDDNVTERTEDMLEDMQQAFANTVFEGDVS